MSHRQSWSALGLARISMIVLAWATCTASAAEGPTATEAASAAAPSPALAKSTRADLALAFLRFEQALRAHPPAEAQLAGINRRFDEATLKFFSGKHAETIREINALTADLATMGAAVPSAPATAFAALLAASCKVQFDPPVVVAASAAEPTAHIRSLYAVPAPVELRGRNLKFGLRLIAIGDSPIAVDVPFSVTATAETAIDASLDLASLTDSFPAGTFLVGITWQADETPGGVGGPLMVSQWAMVPRPLAEIRSENESRLAALAGGDSPLAESVETCKARNALLSDTPAEDNSAQFLADPNRLATEVAAEIAALEAGNDPYYRRAGDYWRVVRTSKSNLPVRVYAPTAAVGEQPVPLVIALHGAGGDENMFPQAYGAGIIKSLADEHGFLLATPRTTSKAETFDLLVEALARHYAIDRGRVYVLGHSMGGGATAALAGSRAEKIRAACCLAGSMGFSKKAKLPPVLVIAAEGDLVVPPGRIESGAQQAIAAGQPVEFRRLPNFGHTLMVGHLLPTVIPWLLEHH